MSIPPGDPRLARLAAFLLQASPTERALVKGYLLHLRHGQRNAPASPARRRDWRIVPPASAPVVIGGD